MNQERNCLTPDEKREKFSDDDKTQDSFSTNSPVPEEQISDHHTSNDDHDIELKENKRKIDNDLMNAANDIQHEVDNLPAVVPVASQLSTDKNEEENNNTERRQVPDDDDDTSKQATQNYDLLDFEQEVCKRCFYFHVPINLIIVLFQS